MVPLPRGGLAAFERWLCERWEARSWYTRRGALWCSYGLLGLRWCEVEVMRPGDLCQGELSLDVRTGKGGARRRIEVPAGMVAATVALRAEVKGGADRVFTRRNGKGVVYQDCVRFTEKATRAVFGRKYTFHCFRHTAAVRVWERTHDVLAVQRYLGHRSLMWTNEYLRSLLVIDVGGAVAFCGGEVRRPRLFDPDGKVGREAVVRAVAMRGKAGASGDEVAFVADEAAEVKGSEREHVCVASELVPMRFGAGEQRWHCVGCGARWRREAGGEMVLEAKALERVELGRDGRTRAEREGEERYAACPSVHGNVEERWGESGVEIWCKDCGKYLGRGVGPVGSTRGSTGRSTRGCTGRSTRGGDGQGRLW